MASACIKLVHSVAEGRCQPGPIAKQGSLPLVAVTDVPLHVLLAAPPVPHHVVEAVVPLIKLGLPERYMRRILKCEASGYCRAVRNLMSIIPATPLKIMTKGSIIL